MLYASVVRNSVISTKSGNIWAYFDLMFTLCRLCGWREPWIGRGCLGIWTDNTGLPQCPTQGHTVSRAQTRAGILISSHRCEPLGQPLEPDIRRFVWGVSDNMMIADHQIAPSDIRQTDHHCQNNMQGTILRCAMLNIPAIGDIHFPGGGIVN